MSPSPGLSRTVSRAAVAGIVFTVSLHLASPRAFGLLLQRSYEFSDLAEQAQIICTAEILFTQSRWQEDRRGRHIYTHVRLNIDQWIKGPAQGPYLDLEVVGGTVGDITEIVTDTPVFVNGQQVLLFLKGSPLYVVGGMMGKVSLVADQILWKGRWIPISSLTPSVGAGRIHALAEPNDAPVTEPNETRPKVIAIEPGIASAGTDTEVNIVGTGFGHIQAPPKVEFFWRSDGPGIKALVYSWTDTRIVCTVPVVNIGSNVDEDWASAGSGPVTVTTDAGKSNEFYFGVTFGYGQHRWKGTNPQVKYYINGNAPGCVAAAVRGAIQSAASSWNNTGATFRFVYASTSTGTTFDKNGRNELCWGSLPDNWPSSTRYWFENGWLIECDTVFNNADPNYTWSTGTDGSRGGVVDVQTVALHEFGHWLMLLDLYSDSDKVMYGELVHTGWVGPSWEEMRPTWAVKRTLHADDVAGIHYIYPPTAAPLAPAKIDYPPSNDEGRYLVTWSSSARATAYELDRSADAGTTWIQVYAGSATYFYESVGRGAYRYRVRASNSVGVSEWKTGAGDCAITVWLGLGEPNDPYLIYTPGDLNRIGGHPESWQQHFRLMADLDLSGYDGRNGRPSFQMAGSWGGRWDPGTPFTGVFDGNGHTISRLTCSGSPTSEWGAGLFVLIGAGGEVKNLRLVDANMTADNTAGPVAAWNDYDGRIINCSASGIVNGCTGGGLVGANWGEIADSRAVASVSGMVDVGGLVGFNCGTVSRCYATGSVTGTQEAEACGGLVGLNCGMVSNCYSTGVVAGWVYVGGLVGYNDADDGGMVVYCHSSGKVTGSEVALGVGGLIGADEGRGLTGSFWDTETSGTMDGVGGADPDPSGVIGKTTTEMKTARTFLDAGWDFVGETANGSEDIWCMPEDGYPRLSWEGACQ